MVSRKRMFLNAGVPALSADLEARLQDRYVYVILSLCVSLSFPLSPSLSLPLPRSLF
jgi:hypothetical protein